MHARTHIHIYGDMLPLSLGLWTPIIMKAFRFWLSFFASAIKPGLVSEMKETKGQKFMCNDA